jgi:DNA-binding FadR family transcriptional regulator
MPDPSPTAPEVQTDSSSAAPSGVGRLGRHSKGLTHELVEAIVAQLTARTIKPGDKLPTELVIMQTYGVSRGVVREALSRLQAAGLVQTHHGVGTFALEPAASGRFQLQNPAGGGIADMLDMLELRTSVESDAAGLAATRRSDEQLREMRSALADFERHLAAVGETVAPDFRFHLAIAQATGNRYFSDLMGHLGLEVIPRTRVSSSWLNVEKRSQHLHKVNQEHQDIYAAIARRDPEAARAAMRIHLVNSRERQRLAHATPAAPAAMAPGGFDPEAGQ